MLDLNLFHLSLNNLNQNFSSSFKRRRQVVPPAALLRRLVHQQFHHDDRVSELLLMHGKRDERKRERLESKKKKGGGRREREGEREKKKNSTSTSSVLSLSLFCSPSRFALLSPPASSHPAQPHTNTHPTTQQQNRLQDQKGPPRRPVSQAPDLGHRRPGALPDHHGELLPGRDGHLARLRRRRPPVVRERARVDEGGGVERRGRGREGEKEGFFCVCVCLSRKEQGGENNKNKSVVKKRRAVYLSSPHYKNSLCLFFLFFLPVLSFFSLSLVLDFLSSSIERKRARNGDEREKRGREKAVWGREKTKKKRGGGEKRVAFFARRRDRRERK